MLTKGHGVPLGLALEGANRHDMKLVRATLDSLVVGRLAPTVEQPHGIYLDMATGRTHGAERLCLPP